MEVLRRRLQASSLLFFFILCALGAPHAAAQTAKAGVAATVKGDVEGVVGVDRSKINVGKDIFSDEVVITDPVSATELMFLDQTNLSITPGSQVTIDRFVYDPNRKKGDVVLNVAKGALRFVTGSQDPNSYQIKTPIATIGVRGTIVDFVVTPQGLAVTMENGTAVVIGANGGITTLTPIQALNVFSANGAVANARNGGMTGAVTALLANSADPATTASSLLVIAGQNNAAGAADMTAVALAVSNANIPALALQAAVSAAIVTSSDPAKTAASVELAAAPLTVVEAQAATSGLAAAATTLQATNPTASARITRIAFPGPGRGQPRASIPAGMLAALRQAAQNGPDALAAAAADFATQNPLLAASIAQIAAGIDPQAAAQIAAAVATAAPQFASRIAAVVARSQPQAGVQVAYGVATAVPGSAAAVAAAVALELPQFAAQVAGVVARAVRNLPGASESGSIADTVAQITGQQGAQQTAITDTVAAATGQTSTSVSNSMQADASGAAAITAQVAASLVDLTPLTTTPTKASP